MTEERSYLSEWQTSAVASFGHDFMHPEASMLVAERASHVEELLRVYAEQWSKSATNHRQDGFYQRLARAINPPKGLIIDLGSGTGDFLLALNRTDTLGIEINPYLLDVAEALYQSQRVPCTRVQNVSMRYSAGGLHLSPGRVDLPVQGSLFLGDDITSLNVTKSLLDRAEVRATAVTYVLPGGHALRNYFPLAETGNEPFHGAPILEDIIRNLGRVCEPGAMFYLADRRFPELEERGLIAHEEVLTKHADKLTIIGTKSVAIIDERKTGLIDLDLEIEHEDGEIRRSIRETPYEVQIIAMQLK